MPEIGSTKSFRLATSITLVTHKLVTTFYILLPTLDFQIVLN